MSSTPIGQAWKQIREDLHLLLSGQRLISGTLSEIPGMSVWLQTFKAGSNSILRDRPIWLITPYKWSTGSLGIAFDSGSVGLSISWDYKGSQLLKPFTMPEHSKIFETCGLLSGHKLLIQQLDLQQTERCQLWPTEGHAWDRVDLNAREWNSIPRSCNDVFEFFGKTLQLSRSFPLIVQWELCRIGKLILKWNQEMKWKQEK